jgi:hypothetical protein
VEKEQEAQAYGEDTLKDKGAPAKAKVKGTVYKIWSGRCINGSYYRKFIVKYHDSFRNNNGDIVFVNMQQAVVGFNEVARKIKDEVSEGDTVYFVGRLKSRDIMNYDVEVFIEIEEPEDIIIVNE